MVEPPLTTVELALTMVELPLTTVELALTMVELALTMVELALTMVELPLTMVELALTMVELPLTMVELPLTMVEPPLTTVELAVTMVEPLSVWHHCHCCATAALEILLKKQRQPGSEIPQLHTFESRGRLKIDEGGSIELRRAGACGTAHAALMVLWTRRCV